MVKYFFFVVKIEQNESGQSRKVLHPLPGQFTYVTRSQPNEPVNPEWKLQLNLQENGKACRCAVDSIVGVKLESNSARDLGLSERRRGDVNFYRTEGVIYFVAPGSSDVPGLENADEEMLRAYRNLVSPDGFDIVRDVIGQNAQTDLDQQQPQQTHGNYSLAQLCQSVPCLTQLSCVFQQRTNELHVIQDSLMTSDSETRALNKTLQISKLMDRMQHGVAKFGYFKQNGDYREAYGTRNPDIIDTFGTQESHTNVSVPDGEHFHYFDIGRRAWRCFCVQDFDNLEEDFLVLTPDNAHDFACSLAMN